MEMPAWMQQAEQDRITTETNAAERRCLWAVLYGLKPYKDGDQWCVLMGEDLATGIAGFGPTPEAAIFNFQTAMHSKTGAA